MSNLPTNASITRQMVIFWDQFVQRHGEHRHPLPRLATDVRHEKMPSLPREHLLIPYLG
jgi:hypothetical protein